MDLYGPDSDVLRLQIDMFLFAMGRGVVKKIDFLDEMNESIEYNGEKCILLAGRGKEYMTGQGTGMWKVYVLPSATYMVRFAQYLRDDNVELEIETFGLNRKNDCFYPESTEIRIPLVSCKT